MAYDAKTADRVRAALKGRRDVAERRLMGHLAFMVNGAMCCSVGPESVLFRVDPDAREGLLTRAGVTAMTMGSRTMTGFVRVAPEALRTQAALAKWIEGGIAAGGGASSRAAGNVRAAAKRKAPAGKKPRTAAGGAIRRRPAARP